MDRPHTRLRNRLAWARLRLEYRMLNQREVFVRPAVTERLHRFERSGGHAPLFVIVRSDRRGRNVSMAAFDADEYDA
jgi:hypothetical protein